MEVEVPKNLRWSTDLMNRAGQQHKFLSVEEGKPSYRLMSGAPRCWHINDQIIYNTEYRIWGTTEDIRMALKNAGISDSEIASVIENSITKNNYQSSKGIEYQAEIDRYVNRNRGP